MACWRKISSLKESASARVATILCQDNCFKEVALRLAKPTFGAFIFEHAFPTFITDPETLSRWADSNEKQSIYEPMLYFCNNIDKQEVDQWDAAVDEQCQRLMEGLECHLKSGIEAWMNRIALEFLSYSRRQELFGVSRYFLMDVLTAECWTKAGRLDEKKLAEQFIKDERLTVMQRYRIACAYCLHVRISQLWNELTEVEKWSTLIDDPDSTQEGHHLVLFWSRQMDQPPLQRNYEWSTATMITMRYGSQAALMSCCERLDERILRELIIDTALESLLRRQIVLKRLQRYMNWKTALVSNKFPPTLFSESFECLNLPSYYNELMCFYLSLMDEEEQLTFFEEAFQTSYGIFILECYLDWPHQVDFMPMIRRLWGIIPEEVFAKCVLTLTFKYTTNSSRERYEVLDKETRYFDYGNLLQTVWEETPEEYKQYFFLDKNKREFDNRGISMGKMLLRQLVKIFPLQKKKDEALFKKIFCYQSKEKRIALMHSTEGERMCDELLEKEQWSFVNELLEECYPKEDIPSFRIQFLQSECRRMLCLKKLQEKREKWVDDLIDWCLETDSEKKQYKYALITTGWKFFMLSFSFLRDTDIATLERIINFCVPSEERKPFMTPIVKNICITFLKSFRWEELDAILAWNFIAEEEIKRFKKDLFSEEGHALHYFIVFCRQNLKEAERFYKCFGLSPEEIKKLKKDTLLSPDIVSGIARIPLTSLRWCLTDEETVIDFQRRIEELYCSFPVIDEDRKNAKEKIDCLMSELLCSFRKEDAQNKTNK
ncbi:uncharacterized protein NPIL_596181 [Nephila pilipes]|uniref:Uncharacterized protein n=1 Tax=Nephila pilipes TaxID=299642 RepID=A0A8X6TQA6_NEPPI|nr:uncharacterized protein NPIL_514861 [Nephila pilipes]GFT32916.1 uncharacterized protein NPIL_596181 [Nephila pilipes]